MILSLWVCMLSLELSPEQLEYQNLAQKFTLEEIIPHASEYDKSGQVVFCLPVHYNYADRPSVQ